MSNSNYPASFTVSDRLRAAKQLGFTAVLLLLLTNQASAQSLRDKLSQSLEVASGNQIEILDITPTALSTIYQVELNTGEMLYTDISGDYLFAGDMYRTTASGLMNVTASVRQERAKSDLEAVPESEMIVFTPAGETKATLHVFTDVSCQYCQKLHGDMEELLARGIEVRYLAYPRGGERAASYQDMISVWCADDRQQAITQAKGKEELEPRECENPVMKHHAIGSRMGITGTPALILPDYRVVPGYMDVDRLAALLGLN